MKRLTIEEFIERAEKVHGNKYDYSLVEYTGNRNKVKIICPIHGIFEQKAQNHMNGDGCKYCSLEKRRNKDFIERTKKVHRNKYDYSLVEYTGALHKVKIVCPIHGIFEQKAQNHYLGQGCPACAGKLVNTKDFIEKAKEVHGNKYDYSLVEYTKNRNKVKIICPIHGMFRQKANDHTTGYGCPRCNESKGEKYIRLYFENKNIYFIYQKTFEDCKRRSTLSYDFYLPHFNFLIEYDGKQHFKMIEHWGGEEEFEKRKENDKIKDEYAEKNNISLLRIPYWEFNEINNILDDKLRNRS